MTSQTLSRLSVLVLILATIMCLALMTSIALLFTIGKPAAAISNSGTGNGDGTTMFSLAEPCECGCPSVRPKVGNYIPSNKATIASTWPWHMLLIYYDMDNSSFPFCGASLITTTHVLTSADCVASYSAAHIGVIPVTRYFNQSSHELSKAYMAEKIFLHESHDRQTYADDVAVIRLRKPILLDESVGLACLAPSSLNTQPLKPGDTLIASGWRKPLSGNATKSDGSEQVQLQYVSQRDPFCAPVVGEGDSQRPGQMCARFPSQSACYGDAGGPLVRSLSHANGKSYYQQVGIVSQIDKCGSGLNVSDLFVRVNYYYEWIMAKIRLSS